MTPFMAVSALDEALESGPYAWPGGYPTYFVMCDGEAMSFEAVKAERDRIVASIEEVKADPAWYRANEQWLPAAHDVNWEDAELFCAHTGARIPSAYAED